MFFFTRKSFCFSFCEDYICYILYLWHDNSFIKISDTESNGEEKKCITAYNIAKLLQFDFIIGDLLYN